MPTIVDSELLAPADVVSLATLQTALRNQELGGREIVDVYTVNDPAGLKSQFDFRDKQGLALPELTVEAVPAATEQAFLADRLKDHTSIAYNKMAIGGAATPVLVSRPNRTVQARGKMSTFGGPNDTGMKPDEGLALVDQNNLAAYVAQHPNLFLPAQAAGTKPLGRNLNPDALYLAARWDYERDVAVGDFLKCVARVRNPLNGRQSDAVAVDWGPSETTGRVADLSPALAKELGLQTDDECIVTLYSLQAGVVKPRTAGAAALAGPAAPAGLKVFTTAEMTAKFGSLEPVTEKPDGAVKVNPQFEAAQIVLADLPMLRGIKGFPVSGKVKCHRLIKGPLEQAFAAIETAGLLDLVRAWDGLWVTRHINHDATRDLSAHSWGIAFDINARWNGFDRTPAAAGTVGSVRELVPFFEAKGFYWGGRFSKPDGMHFQFGK